MSELDLTHTAVIILAAGKGKRIGGHLPKVLYPIVGKPMISYVLKTVDELPIKDVFVVTGYRAEDVRASIGNQVSFVYQSEQLGTGHAVSCSLKELPAHIHTILVMNGDDSAFYDVGTLRNLLQSHQNSRAGMSLLTARVAQPQGLGRIIRDGANKIMAIREEKDATETEKAITEVNIGCYVFSVDWVTQIIDTLSLSPSGEYYLVEAVQLAVEQNVGVNAQQLKNSEEWRGVNTQPELEAAEKFMQQKLIKKYRPKVFIVDLDNVLLNTEAIKEELDQKIASLPVASLAQVISPTKIVKTFHEVYQELKAATGWVSIPDLAAETAQRLQAPILAEPIKRSAYTLPFERYVFPDVKETLSYLKKHGHCVVLADGDLVYLPVKLAGVNLAHYFDDAFIFETKSPHLPQINELFTAYQIIMIDDQIQILEEFQNLRPDAITIWKSTGPYQTQQPHQATFRPTYQITKFEELIDLARKLT